VKVSEDVNPRGEKRPHDGRGRGSGMPGGMRRGRNGGGCRFGGPGHGLGGGRGRGRGREG